MRPTFFESLERRQLLAATVTAGVWNIAGDANRRAPSDVIVVAPAQQDPSNLGVTINGTDAGMVALDSINQIQIQAGRGNDRVSIDLGAGVETITVTVLGGAGNDRITGAGEADTFHGGTGNDRIDGGGGNDLIMGDGGVDQILGGDGDDSLHGGTHNDIVAGGWGRDALFGDKGADRLRGGGDDDLLDGGAGNDRLVGGDGADSFAGGKGADQIIRQEGIDTIAAPPGSSPNQPVDRRDTVSPDDVTTPATRQKDDAQLKQWLIDAAVKQWAWAFDQPANPWIYYHGIDGEVLVARGPDGGVTSPIPTPVPSPIPGAPPPLDSVGEGAGVQAPGSSPGTDDHSDTNTQETGVDEADLVETDGEFLYTLHDSSLVIVDATPAEQMQVISRTEFAGTPQGIYLHGDRLTVISTSATWWIEPMPLVRGGVGVGAPVDLIAPPPEPPKAEVFVTVFDISDRAAPQQIEKTMLDGTYSGSRRVDDRLYLALSNDTWVPPPLIIPGAEPAPDPKPDPTVPVEPGTLVADIAWRPGGEPGGVYESEASYRARLEATPLDELLPGYQSTSIGGDRNGRLIAADDAYVRDLGAPEIGQNLTTVALLNVGDTAGGPTATSTVAGFGGQLYASADSLYLAGAKWSETGARSRLMKFQLAPDAVPLVATGEVAGTVLDQFSMDEEGDSFRIATTDGFGVESTNNLFALEQAGDELNVVGSLTGLKEGEQLRSARFVGDRALPRHLPPGGPAADN